MKKKKIIQLTLILIGFFLIILTYFYYPKFNQNKIDYDVKKEKIEEEIIKLQDKKETLLDKIDEARKYLADGGELEENYLEKMQKDLDQTSSLLKEKKLSLESVEKTIIAKSLENSNIIPDNNKINQFENIEYKGTYNLDPFTVKSEKAHILKDNPDLVYMTKMHVILKLNDGRIVNIKSDEGSYNKVTYDCLFKKNVKATDGEVEISSENLDLLATKDVVEIYNNVNLNQSTGSLVADKIDYNFNTKFFKVSMFSQEKVKMKVIK